MSNRPQARTSGSTSSTFPWIAAVVVAVIVLGVGLGIALMGGGGGGDGSEQSDAPAFGPVAVRGTALPPFDRDAEDPALGAAAPEVVGESPTGGSLTIGAADRPTLLVFVAHWCPHCQAEVPRIVELAEGGELDGVRLVAVVTGTNPAAPNFPPVAWLEREDWPGEILLDDERVSAASAYGLAGYPFLVALDADGRVAARGSGELEPEAVVALVERARAG